MIQVSPFTSNTLLLFAISRFGISIKAVPCCGVNKILLGCFCNRTYQCVNNNFNKIIFGRGTKCVVLSSKCSIYIVLCNTIYICTTLFKQFIFDNLTETIHYTTLQATHFYNPINNSAIHVGRLSLTNMHPTQINFYHVIDSQLRMCETIHEVWADLNLFWPILNQ